MLARALILAIALGLTGSAVALSWYGIGGQSSSVVSARAGSPGGGYGFGGRVK